MKNCVPLLRVCLFVGGVAFFCSPFAVLAQDFSSGVSAVVREGADNFLPEGEGEDSGLGSELERQLMENELLQDLGGDDEEEEEGGLPAGTRYRYEPDDPFFKGAERPPRLFSNIPPRPGQMAETEECVFDWERMRCRKVEN